MKIIDWLKLLFLGSGQQNSSYLAVSPVIQQFVGRKIWERITSKTPDRRQLMAEVAAVKGISEEELLKQIAERMNLPLFLRPKPVDVNSLPDGVLLPDLRQAGILPLTAFGEVTGVVCVDPAALLLMPRLYRGNNIYLGSWQSVLAALDESEQLYRQKRNQDLALLREHEIENFSKVIGRLAEQAKSKNALRISLLSDMVGLSYSFKDGDNREWSGTIDAVLGQRLACYLEDSVANGSLIMKALGSDGQPITLDLGVEHGRILLDFQKESSPIAIPLKETSTSRENTNSSKSKIVPFPRIMRSSAQDLSSIDASLLLIDDNPTFSQVLQKFLTKQGLAVELAASVESAITRLKDKNQKLPELIISDMHMPGVSGLAFVRLLKEEVDWQSIPVVVLTSDESSDSEVEVLAAGADAFVPKTKDPRILSMQVRRLLEVRRVA